MATTKSFAATSSPWELVDLSQNSLKSLSALSFPQYCKADGRDCSCRGFNHVQSHLLEVSPCCGESGRGRAGGGEREREGKRERRRERESEIQKKLTVVCSIVARQGLASPLPVLLLAANGEGQSTATRC